MCIGGKPICICEHIIAPECWEYYMEQQAREIEQEIFEETGEEVTAVLNAWTILSDPDGGDAA